MLRTGAPNGSCFIAAILSHTLNLNLDKQTVPIHMIEAIRTKLEIRASSSLNGTQRHQVAVELGASYVLVDTGRRIASVDTVAGHDGTTRFALIALVGRRHCEPIAPKKGAECGLLDRAALDDWLITHNVAAPTSLDNLDHNSEEHPLAIDL